jgi:hypothetical protein
VSNPWAPKSAFDEADEPLVERARRWHALLWILAVTLGFAAGYFVFDLLFSGIADVLFIRLVFMAIAGGVAGEAASALWVVVCLRSGLSAQQVRLALQALSIPSFVAAYVYRRIHERSG